MEETSGCKTYDSRKDYGECLEEEIKNDLLSLLGCLPPWFTDYSSVCSPANVSETNYTKAFNILDRIADGHYESNCSKPCTTLTYESKHVQTGQTTDGESIWITLDREAWVSKTQLVISGFTLINRIGGGIGFWRNMLWLLLLIPSLLEFRKKLSEKFSNFV